jgi:NADPH:quinone reductase-like Zn-dependent oxidoreductase
VSVTSERIPAAIIERLGGTPRRGLVDAPARGPGQALVEVTAAALNPLDLLIATGRFYAGAPPLPYVPGKEGVGRVLESDTLAPGARWFETPGGVGGDGALASLAAVDEARTLPAPEGVDDALAAALGIAGMAAWLALSWRAGLQPGETVLILGATGVVGSIAVQVAKLLGAGRVVAAGRNRAALDRTRALGADATVSLDGEADLAAAFRAAAGGEIDVTVDPVFGEPMLAAAQASARGGRIVHLGEAAAPTVTLPSRLVRGRMLEILGLSHFGTPDSAKADAYGALTAYAAAGRLFVDIEQRPLDRVADLWRVQARSPNRKLVLVP